jgi:L-arabinose isomerase
MKATINNSTKMQFIHNGNSIKRTTKVQFGWIVEIVRAGEIVRRFECATLDEVRHCE